MPETSEDKTEKFSVSFKGSTLRAVDRHVSKGQRSSYLEGLAERDLRSVGILPEDPVATEIARTRELIETRGLEAVRAAHDQLIDAAVEEAAQA